MHTFFADPRRSNEKGLNIDIQSVSKNPMVQELLHTISGLLAVLNKQRQIIALNDSLLRMIGIKMQILSSGCGPVNP